MQHKTTFFFIIFWVFASACTKIETFYGDCYGIAAPTLGQATTSATYGAIVSNSANKNCTWLAPDGSTYSGSEIDIALTTVSRYGTYKVFYYENGCSSDTATFVVSMNGTTDPPCNPTYDNRWMLLNINYDQNFQGVNSTGLPVMLRWGDWQTTYNLDIKMFVTTPEVGKLYVLNPPAYTVALEDQLELSGNDYISHKIWHATGGYIYCSAANADSSEVYFTFCNVPIVVNDTITAAVTGRMRYPVQ